MRLNKIILQNIRTYTDETIVFNEGITLLSGDIGSGKTSILMAIEFALFGASRTDLPADSLLHSKSNNGSVTLDFDCDKNYIINRPLQRVKNTVKQMPGTIQFDGTEHKLTATEMRSKMLEVLGYPESLLTKTKNDLFRYTVYCPQDHMRTILESPTEQRLEILRKLFHLDKYKKIVDNTDIYCKDVRPQLKVLSSTFQDLKEKKQSVENMLTTINSEQKNLDIIKKEYSLIESKCEKNRQERELIKKIEHLTLEFNTTLKINKHKIEELQKLFKKNEILANKVVPNVISLQNELLILDKKIKQASSFDTMFAHKFQEWKIKRDNSKKMLAQPFNDITVQLKNRLDELNKYSIEEVTTNITSITQKIMVVKEKIASSTALICELNNMVDNLQHNNCTFCGQDITKDYAVKNVEQNKRKINVQKSTVEVLQKSLEQLEKDRTIKLKEQVLAKQAIKDVPTINNQIEQILKQKIDRDNAKKMLLEPEPAYISKTKELTTRYIEIQKKYLEAKEMSAKIESAKNEQETILQQEKKLIKENQDILSKIQSYKKPVINEVEFEEDENELKKLEKQKIEFTSSIKHKNVQFKLLNNELNKMLEQKKSYDTLKERHDWLTDTFTPLLNLIEREQFAKIYSVCNESFQYWFQYLLRNKNMYACLDNSFTPYIEQDTVVPFNYLSGGERTATSLAYRLALSTVINQLLDTIKTKGLLILDEPTDGFSNEQIQSLNELLKELPVTQILLVSHDLALESMVNRVYHIKKQNGCSRIIE